MRVRSIWFFAAIIIFALLISACSAMRPRSSSAGASVSTIAQQFANLKGDATRGKTAFLGTCSACHGPNAKGVPGLGVDLTKSEFALKLSDADFVLFLTKGRPPSDPLNTTKVDMPPRGGNFALGDQDLADIVAFVRTLQK